MRCALLVVGGLFSALSAAAIACTGPASITGSAGSTSAGTGGASGGGGMGGAGGAADIDGLQECIEYCASWEICDWGFPYPDVCIRDRCENFPANIPPICEDLYDEYYACLNHAFQTMPAEFCADASFACSSLALYQCRDDYGCQVFPCFPHWNTPKGDECECISSCQGRKLTTDCWFDGAKQFCECSIEDIPAGICEEPAEYVCDWGAPAQSCCNQYFMLPW